MDELSSNLAIRLRMNQEYILILKENLDKLQNERE